MDMNIGDKLNKAFEAYRQASIEKESAKKQLQQKTEIFEQYTQKLEKQIEAQKQEISELRAQLLSVKHSSGETKSYESAPRKQEVETLSSCDHHPDNTSSSSQRKKVSVRDTEVVEMSPLTFSTVSMAEDKGVLETFQELQETFQRIQALTRKQNDHLRKIWRRSETANEQQFSMPIQCTDVTGEQAEGPFSAATKSQAEEELPCSPSACRRGNIVDEDYVNSLTRLSVRFPPTAESEYEFLNSGPERPIFSNFEITSGDTTSPGTQKSEESVLQYPGPSSSTTSSPSTTFGEGVRGPQQAQWSPELFTVMCTTGVQGESCSRCAFCNIPIRPNDMYSHLNSHFQNQASNGH